MSGKINTFFQKLKPEEKAKNFACALPHVVAGTIFTSTAVAGAIQLASHFYEKAGEIVGKLVGEQRLHLALGALALASAVMGIAYFALYLITSKANKELEQDNQTLIDGINFVANADEASTDLAGVKANQAFTAAQRVAAQV